jgi:hypothetical protein
MTDTKHTALPWVANKARIEQPDMPGFNGSRYRIADAYSSDVLACTPKFKEAQANAAFIVTACNSHYEMLDALKRCTAEIAKEAHRLQFVLGAHERSDVLDRLVQEANAAISKAEGK